MADIKNPRLLYVKAALFVLEDICEGPARGQLDLNMADFLNVLRLVDGFDAAQFESHTGLAWESVAAAVAVAEAKGLLRGGPRDRWVPTPLGRRFLNDLQALFLPASTESAANTDPGGLALAARIG